ncbi:MAG: capsular biosynthesis protein [Lachnospiraceae bacterium]|nr:capsular biosynthesis protein [Lachnospiraceae bacterium]
MIDTHCHLLYGVDDGAKSFEISRMMLEIAKKQGIDRIILTPHYRRGMFPYDHKALEESFERVTEEAELMGIELYTGCEYHVDGEMVDNLLNGRQMTLAGGYYVLCEYKEAVRSEYMRNTMEDLLAAGFIPVIAHAERYECIQNDRELLRDFRKMGAMVQLNADSILGIDGHKYRTICKKILKNVLADVVASDAHGVKRRSCHMLECRALIEKKYGEETAKRLFEINPMKIINSSEGT